jgi:hypothetical protein
LHNPIETRSNAAKILSTDQLVQMQHNISVQIQNLQVLYYQNARNDLKVKEQKTAMEITYVTATNGALENYVTNQINDLTAHIKHLKTQLQQQDSQLREILL